MSDIVVIPESAQKKMLELISAQNNLQAQLQAYLGGLQDGLGLEGNWNLDVATWQFTKKEEPVKPVASEIPCAEVTK